MNKRYMDFVPAKSANSATKSRAVTKGGVVARGDAAGGANRGGATKKASSVKTVSTKTTSAEGMASVGRGVPEVEIESISSVLYVDAPEKIPATSSVSEAKAKKIGGRKARATTRTAAKANKVDRVDFDKKEEKKGDGKDAYQVPKPSFINQNRVVKRPLSKNVYRKQVETPAEEPRGPVTIIEKSEKDSRVGLIVTIIITIILGAAAGTVAFLLLPK